MPPSFLRARNRHGSYVIKRDGSQWWAYQETTRIQAATGDDSAQSASPLTTMDGWLVHAGCGPAIPIVLGPGEHYARIWRDGPIPDRYGYVKEWRESLRVMHMLGRRLQECFRFIEPVRAHDNAYSHELRMLFLVACMEVESACKAVLLANAAAPTGKDFTMVDYRRLEVPMRLSSWGVELSTKLEYGTIAPFEAWAGGAASGLPWYQAHHEVKHGREQHLDMATLGNTIAAVAAASIMHNAQFGYEALAEPLGTGIFHDGEFVVTKRPTWTDGERYLTTPFAMAFRGEKDPFIAEHVARTFPGL